MRERLFLEEVREIAESNELLNDAHRLVTNAQQSNHVRMRPD
jgi:hypothetical protein